MSKYGICSICNSDLIPIWFIDEERKTKAGITYKTGRKRKAVDYLECPNCGKKECIDDTFDGNWY